MSSLPQNNVSPLTNLVNQQEILDKSEQLLKLLKNISGLVSLANTARFEELDEDIYTSFMSILVNIHEKAINLGTDIQHYMYAIKSTEKTETKFQLSPCNKVATIN